MVFDQEYREAILELKLLVLGDSRRASRGCSRSDAAVQLGMRGGGCNQRKGK